MDINNHEKKSKGKICSLVEVLTIERRNMKGVSAIIWNRRGLHSKTE